MESQLFECFDTSASPFLERTVASLLDCMDDWTAEQNKYQYYLRKAAQRAAQKKNSKDDAEEQQPDKNVLTVPNRIDNMLITHQMQNFCQQMNQIAGAQLENLYVAEFALKK